MPGPFNKLTHKLNDYLQAGPKARETILKKMLESLKKLPLNLESPSKATQAYQTMVYTAVMIKFAQKLIQEPDNTPSVPVYPKTNYTVLLTKDGACRFLKDHEQLNLPLFGLSNDEKNNALKSLLDEYLENMHGGLVDTAAKEYDAIDAQAFMETLKTCIRDDDEFSDTTGQGLPVLKAALLQSIDPGKSNSIVLREMLATTRTFEPNGDESAKAAQSNLLNKVRARLQIESFKLTRFYANAVNHILGLMKPKSSAPLSNQYDQWVFEALDAYFKQNHIAPSPLEGSLQTHNSEYLTLPQALAKFESIPSPHLLGLLKGQRSFLKPYNNEPYPSALNTLTQGVESALQALRKETATQKAAFDTALKGVLELQQDVAFKDAKYKPLMDNLKKLHTQLACLAKSDQEDIKLLTLVATNTTSLLKQDSTISVDDYYTFVDDEIQQGKSSAGLAAIGAIMLILAAAAAVLCWVIAAPVMAIAAAAASVTFAASSFTFFALSPQKGLSKITNDIAEQVVVEPLPSIGG